MYACLGLTCHLHFWQNDQGLLRATAVTREGGTNTEKESAHKVDSGEKKNSPTATAGTRTRNFSIIICMKSVHTLISDSHTQDRLKPTRLNGGLVRDIKYVARLIN